MTWSSSSTRQSEAQVKWACCTAAISKLKVESSLSKRAHLLGSLSVLALKVAWFRAIKPSYLTHCRLRHGHLCGWGCRRHVSGSRRRAQLWLSHLWIHLQHLEGTSTLGLSKDMGEHKQRPALNNKIMLFLMRGAPFPPTLCPLNWPS